MFHNLLMHMGKRLSQKLRDHNPPVIFFKISSRITPAFNSKAKATHYKLQKVK